MIYSFSSFGYEGSVVEVSTRLKPGIPAFEINGFSDFIQRGVVQRVRSSINHCVTEFPTGCRVVTRITPEDLRKDDSTLDLPIALSVLQEKERTLRPENFISPSPIVFAMGDLDIVGGVANEHGIFTGLVAINGFIPSAQTIWAIVPDAYKGNIPSDRIRLVRVSSLPDAYKTMMAICKGEGETVAYETGNLLSSAGKKGRVSFKRYAEYSDLEQSFTLDDISGLSGLKWVMAVAASGRLNMLVTNSLCDGVHTLLQRYPELVPKLTEEETPSVERIYDIAGLKGRARIERPFRMPHSTASIEGMCGGGVNCRPGEISLAHNGTLYLNMASEFKASVLQMLRVPLENKTITLSRAGRTTVFPADFQLIVSTQPCPCGNYGSKTKVCLCSTKAVEQYWRKFSSPLLDRIDIKYHCSPKMEDILKPKVSGKNATVNALRERILNAWEMQYKRQGKLNRDLSPTEIANLDFDSDAKEYLRKQVEKYSFSPRGTSSVVKVARTIADMYESEKIRLSDVEDAVMLHGSSSPFEFVNDAWW